MDINDLTGKIIVKVEDMKWQTLLHLDNGMIVRIRRNDFSEIEICEEGDLEPLYELAGIEIVSSLGELENQIRRWVI